jgi:hypothetical protein
MRVAVFGAGAVGARAARQLASSDDVESIAVHDPRPDRVHTVVSSLGDIAAPFDAAHGDVDAALLAGPPGTHVNAALGLLEAGVPTVSACDALADVEGLLDLDREASERGVPLVVGAAFSPGLTCLLARHAAARFDHVDEVHVAKVGTGGPACARQHHDALAGSAVDWRDGGWVERRGGSGRELCWFPDPVRALDCYRAELADAILLVRAFPGVKRVTGRVGANRRDRLTARVPMLRPPHPEGGLGAVRVEVRGRQADGRSVQVLGAVDRPAVAAASVAAVALLWAATGRVERPGAGGLAELVDPIPFLAELARRGVKAAVFEGAAA